MRTKSQRIRELVESGDVRKALRIAKSMQLPRDDNDRVAFSRAWEAIARPEFCLQLKQDPEALFAVGVEALKRRFCRDE